MFPALEATQIVDGYNLNVLTKPGIYVVTNPTNGPGTGTWYITVYVARTSAGNARQFQLAWADAGNTGSTRSFTGVSGWTSWQTIAGGLGSSPFLPKADLIDDSEASNTDTYFYFGWYNVAGVWLIRRQERATALTVDASTFNNAQPDLNTAWPLRESLAYA
jgi:hypothetical protein